MNIGQEIANSLINEITILHSTRSVNELASEYKYLTHESHLEEMNGIPVEEFRTLAQRAKPSFKDSRPT